jgi:demethylmenaquinone methyltransferase/2-methoxy-6-polyprenyl-1,4-benzoquinol methylase
LLGGGGFPAGLRLAFQIGVDMSSPAHSGAPGAAPSHPPSARKREALELFRGLPSRYDALSAALSFWQDPRWRRALVDALGPTDDQHILDVASGTGMVLAEVLARSRCDVVGLDQSPDMLAVARARFASEPRVRLVEGQAEALPFADASFDGLTFTYLLRYVDDPRATLAELARVLRPGARASSLEFGVPPWAPARAAWRLYTGVGLPLLGGLTSPEWREVGRFLSPSIRGFYATHPLASLVGYWREAGFEDVRVRRMSFGGGVITSARRAGARRAAEPGGAGAPAGE